MQLGVHGSKPKYFHKLVGGNFRLDALQAAVLLVKLGHLDAWSQKRRENAAAYDAKFAASGLTDSGHISTPVAVYKDSGDRNHHIYNQYTIRAGNAADRDPLRAFLGENGIGTEIYYPLPLHLQECFRDLGYKQGDFPASEDAAARVLSLPIYPELTEAQQDYVVQTIVEFFKNPARGANR